MTYCGSWQLEDLLVFSVNTHNPTTGAETDADSVPTYRVYEDETGTPILTGSMAKLDDAGTTGFYSEQITLSAANGLENGKSYNIRIAAIVGGVTGSTTRFFQVEAAPATAAAVAALPTAAAIRAEMDSNSTDFNTIIANLAMMAGYVDTEVAAILGAVDTEVAAIKTVTDILNGLMENVSGYRFTTKALEQAPSGGGGGDAPTVEEIDAELSSVHGAGLWGSAALSGSSTITITVTRTDDDSPLFDVPVTLKASGVTRETKRTDALGVTTFAVDAGTFTASAGPVPGFSSVADQSVAVGANSITLNPLLVPAATDPDLCTVFGYVADEGGPEDGVEVFATLQDPPIYEGAVNMIPRRVVASSVAGTWTMELLRGNVYRFNCPDSRLSVERTLPDSAGPVNLADLLP